VVDLTWPSLEDAEEVVVRFELTVAARLLVPPTLELAVPVVEREAVVPKRELLVVATLEAVPLEVERVRDVVELVVLPIVDAARDAVPTLEAAELLGRDDTREAADAALDDEVPIDELFKTLETLELALESEVRDVTASLESVEEAATRATLEGADVPRVGVIGVDNELTRLGAPVLSV